MDIFSHAGYGYAMLRFRGGGFAWTAALCGAAPDLFWYIPFKIDQLTRHGVSALYVPRPMGIWQAGGPPMPADLLYGYDRFYVWTHSLVVLAVAALVILLVGRRRWLWLTLPYGFHILLDIPTHARFGTPVFYPFSAWTFAGMSWVDPRIFVPNLVVLTTALFWSWRRYGGGPTSKSEMAPRRKA